MKIYFVRHGETNSNLRKSVVSFDDKLTDAGREQAGQLAERLAGIPIDAMFASPSRRTKETAEIIAKKIGKNAEVTPLLLEKKWPSEIEGKLLNDPEVEKIFELLKEKNNADPTWHYSDEENFSDIKKRAELFIEHVSGLPYTNILAVSHEYFIKTVIATMMHGDKLAYAIFRDFFHFASLDNTSLTLCENRNNAWKLIMLNEQGPL